ncbi:HepT-like ribonuclease domain-containing protein [Telluribacter humicola]
MKNPVIYLEHIADCIAKIREYTKGLDEEGFLQHNLIQDAVIRNFEIIGEATKQLDIEFRSRYPDIEWKKIAGMR